MQRSILTLALFLVSLSSQATVLELSPPSDPLGTVYTSYSNDGYALGRGIQFDMTASETLRGVGLYHDLTNINLHIELSQLSGTSSVLLQDSRVVSTQGLEWVDFIFDDIMLNSGSSYRLDFRFNGNGNQNFFYREGPEAFDQGSFANIDGTLGGQAWNRVMAAIRLDLADPAEVEVPEPSPFALLSAGLLLLAFKRAKRSWF